MIPDLHLFSPFPLLFSLAIQPMKNVTSTENAQKYIILNSVTLTMKINLDRQCVCGGGEGKIKKKREENL